MERFGEVWRGLERFGEVLKNTPQSVPGLTLGRFWRGQEEVRPVCSYIIILQGEVRDATPLQSRSSLHCTGAPPSNGAPSTAFPLPPRHWSCRLPTTPSPRESVNFILTGGASTAAFFRPPLLNTPSSPPSPCTLGTHAHFQPMTNPASVHNL